MNSKPWLKMWVKWLNDPEMVSLTLAEAGAWWKLYTLAHNCAQKGAFLTDHGRPLSLDEIRGNLRLRKSEYPSFDSLVGKMVKEGMLHWDNDTLVVTHYEEDQTTASSDTKEARAERQRKRRKVLLEDHGIKDSPVPLPVRRQVIERDRSTCQHCGKVGDRTTPTSVIVIDPSDGSPFEMDHIIPRTQGGSDEPENIVLSCRACNRTRTAGALSQESRDSASPLTTPLLLDKEGEREGDIESHRDRLLQTRYKPTDIDSITYEISNQYSANIGPIREALATEIREFSESFGGPVAWIKPAFKEAVIRNKKSWHYVRTILENWDETGGPDDESKPKATRPRQRRKKPITYTPGDGEDDGGED